VIAVGVLIHFLQQTISPYIQSNIVNAEKYQKLIHKESKHQLYLLANKALNIP